MKILSAAQIRDLDKYTIENEPISSIDLMEKAATAFVNWLCNQYVQTRPVYIFCGKGNNGGDGLAIARILISKGYEAKVFIADYTSKTTGDFDQNLARLHTHSEPIVLHSGADFPELPRNVVCIDALLGSGLSRPAEGLLAEIILKLNAAPNKVISVDIASGLYADMANAKEDVIIKPRYTVSFQMPKLAFLLPQNAEFVGEWHVVDIGLSSDFIENTDSPYFFTDKPAADALIKPRNKFSHKGTYGHALLMAGSYGKMGAAVLSGKACLRSGVGLLTMHSPSCGYDILQTSIPEAMVLPDDDAKKLTSLADLGPYSVVGIGPGIGKSEATVSLLKRLLLGSKSPIVIDADALNILSENRELLDMLPENTILTPHPKEFQRLAGESKNEYERLEIGRTFARKHKVVICLKGNNTAVILPTGEVHFNSTGNPGMATGGTGDVLTGIITALVAQQYIPAHAAIFGVYQHGLAGDRAAEQRGYSALIASDVAEHLGW